MQLFIVDASTDKIFGGNQAGVVLLRDGQAFPDELLMQRIAAELKHSETAFVRRINPNTFELRYFTPESEVPLCGHATVSAFTVLREQGWIASGKYLAQTQLGKLDVVVEADQIWLRMPRGETIKQLSPEEAERVYAAYQISKADRPPELPPAIVKVGLPDIMFPVCSKKVLDQAVQNRDEVIRLTRELGLVGVHMFYCTEEETTTAYCRNFAPLFGIDEESATGTSNASLTHFLLQRGLVKPGTINRFVQGEAMGKPSVILSRVEEDGTSWIGGSAVISVQGELKIDISCSSDHRENPC
ncbi:MAG TPA: PhzF family phenazine biosynthesis protein [Clostridia bacterium]|nr:PhzF family phenazine biosynthesis protein [Clostridia bacterium]